MQFQSKEIEANYQQHIGRPQYARWDSYMFWPNTLTHLSWYFLMKVGRVASSPRAELASQAYIGLLVLQYGLRCCLPAKLKKWKWLLAIAFRLAYPIFGIGCVCDFLSLYREFLYQPHSRVLFHWLLGGGCIVAVFHTLLLPVHFSTHLKLQSSLLPVMLGPVIWSLSETADQYTKGMCMKAWSMLDILDVVLQATAPFPGSAPPTSSLPCHATLLLLQITVGVMFPALLLYILEARSRAVFVQQMKSSRVRLSAEAKRELETVDSSLVSVLVYPVLLYFMTLPLVFQGVKLGVELWSFVMGPGPLAVTVDEWETFHANHSLMP